MPIWLIAFRLNVVYDSLSPKDKSYAFSIEKELSNYFGKKRNWSTPVIYNLLILELLKGCLACPGYVNKPQKGDIDRLQGDGGAKQRRSQVALNIHASIGEARRVRRGVGVNCRQASPGIFIHSNHMKMWRCRTPSRKHFPSGPSSSCHTPKILNMIFDDSAPYINDVTIQAAKYDGLRINIKKRYT